MDEQPRLIAEERAEYSAAQPDAERAAYVERLAEKLRDREFRKIEGFPIGDDEAILALSDPPYYTACPNPFLPEILEQWQEERRTIRAELGLPDDAANGYTREPFAADVSEGKNDPIYNAHSYHTKVPHKAIMRYVLHYTDPGDIVFDGFCGTGMTGVASQLCGDKRAVESLGYRVDAAGVVYDGQMPISRVGARKTVLVDLSPAATFIAYNYNTPVDADAFEQEAKRILAEVEQECGWMYETWHPHCDHLQRVKGRINYTVWSDVFVCPNCSGEIVFWDAARDKATAEVVEVFPCPHCGSEQRKRTLDRAWETVYDQAAGRYSRRARQVPVAITYRVGKKYHEKEPDAEDLARIRQIEGNMIPHWFPTDRMMFKGKRWGDMWRPYHGEVERPTDFFTFRNLRCMSSIATALDSSPMRMQLRILLLDIAKLVSRMRMPRAGQPPQNMYLPSVSVEANPIETYRRKVIALNDTWAMPREGSGLSCISASSGSALHGLPEESVDYIFTDPPFGGNIIYSELSFFFEAWLRVYTNQQPEAIMSKSQEKQLQEYQSLVQACFREFIRILRPGRWITIEFHNSQNAVWNAIQEAALRVGFVVADVRTLDKRQGTFKQQTTTGAVKQDLVISAYKPTATFERNFQSQAGSESGAWTFVEEHLHHLPTPQMHDNRLEVLAERQAYLLFDRMVAFHIQRGLTVPLGAAEFYAGLRQRFIERDGMYFLPLQAQEYDRLRLQAHDVEQLPLIVSDEKSAILWLRRHLAEQPQTYQDVQPRFLRELHQAGHEKLPELRDILEENFLQDEAGRWYVPDPAHAGDLEKLRERSLLREFREYVEGRGRLKIFRGEAVRAGFRDAWRRRDYAVIVAVARRLPERVLQEDADLLMYYDNALLRMGDF